MKKTKLCASAFFYVLLFSSAMPLTDALFSPDDHPKNKLIEFITNTRKKIYAAVFTLTDKDIIDSLVAAKQRGIDVQIVVDTASVTTPYAKVSTLFKNKIPVFVFDTKPHYSKKTTHKTFAPLMHNKFAVIDGKTVWTGSFNWTVSADTRNQENVIITDDKGVCQKYESQFHLLTERSHLLTECETTQKENVLRFNETSFWSNPFVNIQKWLAGE